MTYLPRKHKGLWIALILYGLGILFIFGSAMINRLGPERGRLSLEDCRLITKSKTGLISMLANGGDGIRLDTRLHLMPPETIPSLAERLALGEPVIKVNANSATAFSGYVVLDATGQALTAWQKAQPEKVVDRPLIIRDGDRDMDRMAQTYGDKRGIAIARGRLQAIMTPDGPYRRMWLASPNPTLPQGARHSLQNLPQGLQNNEACRSRFLLDIHYGALGDPWISSLRPLSGPQMSRQRLDSGSS